MDHRILDLAVILVANLVNLTVLVIFLARARRAERLEYVLGLVVVAAAVPAFVASMLNLGWARPWWFWVLPLPLVLYCLVELLLDYVLKIDFRNSALLWPYLAVYYAAALALVGYAFAVHRIWGFVTLATYLLSQLAAWYAYNKLGKKHI